MIKITTTARVAKLEHESFMRGYRQGQMEVMNSILDDAIESFRMNDDVFEKLVCPMLIRLTAWQTITLSEGVRFSSKFGTPVPKKLKKAKGKKRKTK